MKKVFLVSLIVFLLGVYGIMQFSIFEDTALKITFAIIFLISSIPLGVSASWLVGIVLDRYAFETHEAQGDHEIEWVLRGDQTEAPSNRREWYHKPINQRLTQIVEQPEDPSVCGLTPATGYPAPGARDTGRRASGAGLWGAGETEKPSHPPRVSVDVGGAICHHCIWH